MLQNNLNQRKFASLMEISDPLVSKFLNTECNYKSSTVEKMFNAMGYHPVINYTKIKK